MSFASLSCRPGYTGVLRSASAQNPRILADSASLRLSVYLCRFEVSGSFELHRGPSSCIPSSAFASPELFAMIRTSSTYSNRYTGADLPARLKRQLCSLHRPNPLLVFGKFLLRTILQFLQLFDDFRNIFDVDFGSTSLEASEFADYNAGLLLLRCCFRRQLDHDFQYNNQLRSRPQR